MSWNKEQFKKYDPETEGYGSTKEWRRSFGERMGFDEAKRILKDQDAGPHEILGILATASKVEIKKAYFAKVKEWHPDVNPHRVDEATEMMKKINAAYTILTEK